MDKELIKLAKKAGFGEVKGVIGVTYFSNAGPMLEAFAKLIIAAEREACARLVEERPTFITKYAEEMLEDVAKLIRARGGE